MYLIIKEKLCLKKKDFYEYTVLKLCSNTVAVVVYFEEL